MPSIGDKANFHTHDDIPHIKHSHFSETHFNKPVVKTLGFPQKQDLPSTSQIHLAHLARTEENRQKIQETLPQLALHRLPAGLMENQFEGFSKLLGYIAQLLDKKQP